MALYRAWAIPEIISVSGAQRRGASLLARTADIEFAFPWGWGELEVLANRTTST